MTPERKEEARRWMTSRVVFPDQIGYAARLMQELLEHCDLWEASQGRMMRRGDRWQAVSENLLDFIEETQRDLERARRQAREMAFPAVEN